MPVLNSVVNSTARPALPLAWHRCLNGLCACLQRQQQHDSSDDSSALTHGLLAWTAAEHTVLPVHPNAATRWLCCPTALPLGGLSQGKHRRFQHLVLSYFRAVAQAALALAQLCSRSCNVVPTGTHTKTLPEHVCPVVLVAMKLVWYKRATLFRRCILT